MLFKSTEAFSEANYMPFNVPIWRKDSKQQVHNKRRNFLKKINETQWISLYKFSTWIESM